MRKSVPVSVATISLLLASACAHRSVSDKAAGSQVERTPSEEKPSGLLTRDGQNVRVPGLVRSLPVPACGNDTDECIGIGEAELFQEITRISFAFQGAQNPASQNPSQRDFHPKQHACLAGWWKALDGLPPELEVGVLARKEPVKVLLRFSNGSPKSPAGNGATPPDSRPDARGLAIKLVDIAGVPLLNTEDARSGTTNQDFVMINYPAFFLRSPKSYPQFLSSLTQGKNFFGILDPLELEVLKKTNKPVSDVLSERFFSQVPYYLGERNIKYSVRSCTPDVPEATTLDEAKNPNFLRERVKARLAKGALCLIFSVQRKGPKMKVEDAAEVWSETESPFTDVARIQIPGGQDINDPKRDGYCEDASFNPWNSVLEHRPAGAINRARLAVYTAISRKRRLENARAIREPRGSDPFFELLAR